MIAPLPGVTATKPGSCTQPLPGIDALIVDDHGEPVRAPDAGGYLVIGKPWPSMLRTIWGDNERYLSTYWERFHGRYYVAGDSAHRDADGFFWIMGRIDDVLKVSGHRLGTMEIESALVANPRVAEAAVVGKADAIKGESVFAFVVLRGSAAQGRQQRAGQGTAQLGRRAARRHRQARQHPFRRQPAQDPLGQDHAPACCARSRTISPSSRTYRRSKTRRSSINCAAAARPEGAGSACPISDSSGTRWACSPPAWRSSPCRRA